MRKKRTLALIVAASFVTLTPVAAIADEPPAPRDASSSHLIISPQDAAGVATNLDMTPQELAEFASSNEPKTLIEDPATGEILGIYSGIYSPDALASLDYELDIPEEVINSITLAGVDFTPPDDSNVTPQALVMTAGYCAIGALCTTSVSPYPFYGFDGLGITTGLGLQHQNSYYTGKYRGRAAAKPAGNVGSLRPPLTAVAFPSPNQTIIYVERAL